MQILSKGWKLPQTGDFGSIWFPAMEDNIQQMNSHNHDGINSEKISGVALQASTVTVLAASFIDQGNGYFRATVNTPGGLDPSTFVITARNPTTKEPMYLKQERLSSSQFYLYINVAQNVEVCYGV
jgi:hypothetical protein